MTRAGPIGSYSDAMPLGTYRVLDGSGTPVGTEEFRCATAPAGWRYFSSITTDEPTPHRESVDLVVDREGRPVRCRIDTGSHELLVAPGAGTLAGTRDGEPIEEPWASDTHLDYLSPCFNAATAARLEGTTEIEVVFIEPVTCALRRERQRYERLGPQDVATPVGRFQAEAWRYTALSSGWSRRLWVAGSIVVAYEDLFELMAYEPGQSGPFTLS